MMNKNLSDFETMLLREKKNIEICEYLVTKLLIFIH